MRKHLELSDPASCLNKADDEEPIFVLRAKDPVAAAVIRLWAVLAGGVHEASKIAAARRDAMLFESWFFNSLMSGGSNHTAAAARALDLMVGVMPSASVAHAVHQASEAATKQAVAADSNEPQAPIESAGNIAPSSAVYMVTEPHNHLDVKKGDLVRVVRVGGHNKLYRFDDPHIHDTTDHLGQYVHLQLMPMRLKA